MKELPSLVASSVALAALGASLLNKVEPMECLIRGGIAFVVGHVCASMWNMFFTPARSAAPSPEPSSFEPETSQESTQPDGSSG